MSKMISLRERFEQKFVKGHPDECWEWTASKSSRGYGQISDGKRLQPANRISYQLNIGKIPEGACVIQKCGNKLCVNPKHLYLGHKRSGSITPVLQRFEKLFAKGTPTDCWEWQSTKNQGGYGRLRVDGRLQVAHRVSYRLYVGELSEDICVLHKCDNPGCVNPSHLFLGTQSDNMIDCSRKGRMVRPKGEDNHQSKLTKKAVLEIRASQEPAKIAALKFGITPEHIRRVRNYEFWKEV